MKVALRYNAIRKSPIPNITAKPLEVNILEWCCRRCFPLSDREHRSTGTT